MVEAADAGMLAASALIAHGRGEAYDYLLGEATCAAADLAIIEAAARLSAASRSVISVNGNTVALAADDLLRCAAVLECAIEVNIYYRTEARMEALLSHLASRRETVASTMAPDGWNPEERGKWEKAVLGVPILGEAADGRIPGLEGPRATCCSEGILSADAILVPLEDGDRCEALVEMGCEVIVVDLNPLSRTARTATITIVDEIGRVAARLLAVLLDGAVPIDSDWDNDSAREGALSVMLEALARDAAGS